MDNETQGVGNSINYKYRVDDPRLGRFLSIDPLAPKYPFYSPYAFSGNRVIDAVELEGLEPETLAKQNCNNADLPAIDEVAVDKSTGKTHNWTNNYDTGTWDKGIEEVAIVDNRSSQQEASQSNNTSNFSLDFLHSGLSSPLPRLIPDGLVITGGANGCIGPLGTGISLSLLVVNKGNNPGCAIYLNPESSQGLDGSASVTLGGVYFDNPDNWREDYRGRYGGGEVGALGCTGGISGGYTGPEVKSMGDVIEYLKPANYGEKVRVIYGGVSGGMDMVGSARVFQGCSIPILEK
jgi:hypothetical protein